MHVLLREPLEVLHLIGSTSKSPKDILFVQAGRGEAVVLVVEVMEGGIDFVVVDDVDVLMEVVEEDTDFDVVVVVLDDVFNVDVVEENIDFDVKVDDVFVEVVEEDAGFDVVVVVVVVVVLDDVFVEVIEEDTGFDVIVDDVFVEIEDDFVNVDDTTMLDISIAL